MYPGISTQIFGEKPLEAGHLRMIRDAGFDAAEIYGVPPHFDCFDTENIKNIAGSFRQAGLVPAAVHAPYMEPPERTLKGKALSLSLGNASRRARALSIVRAAIEAAKVVGSKTVVVHFGFFGDVARGEVLSNIISSLILLEEDLKGSGISIAFENVATPISVCSYMLYLLDKYDFRSMGICVDIAHANLNEDPSYAIESCRKKLIHIHASDNLGAMDEHLYPTEGSVRWPRVMAALKKIRYDGCFTFEPRKDADPVDILSRCRQLYDILLSMPDEEENHDPS